MSFYARKERADRALEELEDTIATWVQSSRDDKQILVLRRIRNWIVNIELELEALSIMDQDEQIAYERSMGDDL